LQGQQEREQHEHKAVHGAQYTAGEQCPMCCRGFGSRDRGAGRHHHAGSAEGSGRAQRIDDANTNRNEAQGETKHMTLLSTVLLALAMSADAFAAAICTGTALERPRWSEALRTGAVFGVIEALTPLAGWLLGSGAASYIKAWDHWIAFSLLAGLGVRMTIEGLKPPAPDAPTRPARHSFWLLAATGLATSIDAMVVGVSLAFIDTSILRAAAAIGVATFFMATVGVMVGRAVGAVVGKRAEALGGLVLVVIGTAILVEHLNGGA